MASTIPQSMPSNFPFDLLANLQQQLSVFPDSPTSGLPFLNPVIAAAMLAKASSASMHSNAVIPSPNSAFLQPTASVQHPMRPEPGISTSSAATGGSNGEIPTPATPMSAFVSPTPGDETGGETPLDGEDKPKRRNRLGGSSVKTAEVWRFFEQIPPPEQAAKCQVAVKRLEDGTEELCNKTIKATNSSTTGMIRHLRSCHAPEYKVLQEARKNTMIMKAIKSAPDEATRNEMLLQIQKLEMCSPSMAAHSALINLNKVKIEKADSCDTAKAGLLTPHPKHTVDSIIGHHADGDFNEANAFTSTWSEHPQLRHPYMSQVRTSPGAPSGLDNFLEMLKNSQSQQGTTKIDPANTNHEKAAHKRVADSETAREDKFDNEKQTALDGTPRRHSDFHPKRIKIENMEDAENIKCEPSRGPNVPLSVVNESKNVKEACATPEQTQVKKKLWSHESKEAKRLSEQIALMLLMDNHPESMVEQQGFRNLIQAIAPKYQLPTSKTFAEKIIPQVKNQLRSNIQLMKDLEYCNEVQCNNPFGLGEAILQSTTNSSSRTSPHDRSGASPATTVESGYHDDRDDVENRSTSSSGGNSACRGKNENFDAMVQRSIISAQNISQSFSSSIELNSTGVGEMDSDTSSSVSISMSTS
ncbi:zinc finger BED domain-containing protein 3 [Ditylenchus destructor]|nr:zinc finger BED domain-containing protein 3 [Ditylenchus destructor]